jgi:hypothetical protein
MNITATCHIRDKTIQVNRRMVYENKDAGLDTFLEGAYDFLKVDYTKFYKMDRLSKVGFLAAEVLLNDRALTRYEPVNRNIILANSNASLDSDIKFAKAFSSPAVFVYTLPNIVAGEICIRHGIKGETAFFISEEFDAALMTSYVDSVMLKVLPSGAKPCCVGGWIDLLDERHDVFLYLVENVTTGREHSPEQLVELYRN